MRCNAQQLWGVEVPITIVDLATISSLHDAMDCAWRHLLSLASPRCLPAGLVRSIIMSDLRCLMSYGLSLRYLGMRLGMQLSIAN